MYVLIHDIIPYARNARQHSDADLSALMESIREFGFRGRIQLVSPENPVLVNGHGRVEACKRLGMTEIPDEHIEFVGDLNDEQVRAYRIADNKTAEGSRWNRSMLRAEIKSLKKVDMSRFGVDFASKVRPYGAERLRTDGGYNLDLVNRSDCGRGGMPRIKGCMAKPADMVGFNYAKGMAEADKAGKCCHFFIDDYQFERVWNKPRDYIDILLRFDCVLTPDFSLYMDMPDAMQRWSRYRSQALGMLWQRVGIRVVPALSWAQPESYAFCFDGVPKRSTVAVSTAGVKGDENALAVWRDGMVEAMRQLRPKRVLLYGGRVDFDFGDTEVIEYANGVTERMAHGRTRCEQRYQQEGEPLR